MRAELKFGKNLRGTIARDVTVKMKQEGKNVVFELKVDLFASCEANISDEDFASMHIDPILTHMRYNLEQLVQEDSKMIATDEEEE